MFDEFFFSFKIFHMWVEQVQSQNAYGFIKFVMLIMIRNLKFFFSLTKKKVLFFGVGKKYIFIWRRDVSFGIT